MLPTSRMSIARSARALSLLLSALLAGCVNISALPTPPSASDICHIMEIDTDHRDRADRFRRKIMPTNIDGAIAFMDDQLVSFMLLGARDNAGVEHWYGINGASMSISPAGLTHLEGLPVADFTAVGNGTAMAAGLMNTPAERSQEIWLRPQREALFIHIEDIEGNAASMSASPCCPDGNCIVTRQRLSVGSRLLPTQRIIISDVGGTHVRAAVFPLEDGFQTLRFVRLTYHPE